MCGWEGRGDVMDGIVRTRTWGAKRAVSGRVGISELCESVRMRVTLGEAEAMRESQSRLREARRVCWHGCQYGSVVADFVGRHGFATSATRGWLYTAHTECCHSADPAVGMCIIPVYVPIHKR